MTADELRRRLVEIDDELRELPGDDFERRHRLLSESDECRAALDAALGPVAREATREWAERAGHKGSHEVDYDVMKARIRAVIGGSGASP